jgi:hypothetical protein
VQRTRSGTSIEPDALPLVALAEQLELGLSALRRDQSQREDTLSGVVRLSLGEGFVRPVVGLLSELRRQHPGLQIELTSEARFAAFCRREADIAIRKAKSSSPKSSARRVASRTARHFPVRPRLVISSRSVDGAACGAVSCLTTRAHALSYAGRLVRVLGGRLADCFTKGRCWAHHMATEVT